MITLSLQKRFVVSFQFRLTLVIALLTSFVPVSVHAKSGSENLPPRQRMSLNGTWKFLLNEKPKAPSGSSAIKTEGTIQVPGSWDIQGYGLPTKCVRHSYIGKATYERTIRVPGTWTNREIWLVLEGIQRYAQVSINGKNVGEELIGCVGAHELRIDEFVTPGTEARIQIVVDSKQRWTIDALMPSTALFHLDRGSFPHFPWGGLWGNMYLETRPTTRITESYLRYYADENTCKAELEIEATTTEELTLELSILDQKGNRVAKHTIDCHVESGTVLAKSIKTKLGNIEQWSPETPTLYQIELVLKRNETVIDQISYRYGFRDIQVRGRDILLNGKPYYLVGYGDDHVFTTLGTMHQDKEAYLKILRLAKSYGFNHVRPHSAILPHCFYEACDEIGMLVVAEFVIAYPKVVAGTGWLWHRNVPDSTQPEVALDLYKTRFQAVIREFRHHPSIFCWSGGNELFWEGFPIQFLRYDFQSIARACDPDRLFVYDTGDLANNRLRKHVNLNKKFEKEPLDIYVLSFNYYRSPFLPGKYEEDMLNKPIVAHETGNYLTFPRLDMYDRFDESVFMKPFWMKEGVEKIKATGLYEESFLWSEVSERHYLLHNKTDVEQIRLNPGIAGYHWWLFQDFWTTSNGLLDYFGRQKSITPDDVLPFQAKAIVLQKGLRLTGRSGETLQTEIFISNYDNEIPSGNCNLVLFLDGKQYSVGNLKFSPITTGKVVSIGQLETMLPEVQKATRGTLLAQVRSGKSELQNSWPIWIYPKQTGVPMKNDTAIVIYSNETFFPKSWKVCPIPKDAVLPTDAVYIVTHITTNVADVLSRGAGVILLGDDEKRFPSLPTNYKSTWWKAGDFRDRNDCGQFVYPNTITDGLDENRGLGVNWFSLCHGARKYLCDDFKEPVNILIRVLPGIAMIENNALLAEMNMGKGHLILSGLQHQKSGTSPENETILKRMIEQAAKYHASQRERN